MVRTFVFFHIRDHLYIILLGINYYFNFFEGIGSNGFKIKWIFVSSRLLNIFFVKFLWLGPWISRVDWCQGHWSGSTFMAVRLSDIIREKSIFCVFRPFLSICWTASLPYRLGHTNFLPINKFYQSMKFSQKI